MGKKLGFLLALLGTAAIILAGILAAVHWIGTDAKLYYELQMDAQILPDAGISEQDLVRLDEALANCLKGDPDALGGDEPLMATVSGMEQPAFNAREQQHMEDCRKLFELLRTVLKISAIAGPAAFILGAVLCRNRRRVRLAAWLAPLILLIPMGGFAAWAALDFNGAFNFFHRLLFTNDLWLLDPRTDLLIRLCPASMFQSMGIRIGILSLIAALAVPTAVTICTSENKERK